MKGNLPGVFSAAGLMVPSIMPLPIPFIDGVTGTVEYMVASVVRQPLALLGANVVAPTVAVREGARSRMAEDWRRR